MKKTGHILLIMLAALICGCHREQTMLPESIVYTCEDYRITSRRIFDSEGKVVFSAEDFSGNNADSDTLSLVTDYPLVDSLFAASVNHILSRDATLPQHVPHGIWLADVFVSSRIARENTGADTLREYFPVPAMALPWPASSDRSAMVTAAVETAFAVNDTLFTSHVKNIGLRTLRQDFDIAWSSSENLLYGAQTYLLPQPDLYPEWMEDVDIYQSPCLGTNIAAVGAVEALNSLLRPEEKDSMLLDKSRRVRNNIAPAFYQPNMKYYSAYRYCYPYPVTTQATDNMAQSLGVVLDVLTGDTAVSVIAHTPVFSSSTPTLFPVPRRWAQADEHKAQPVVRAFRALAASKVHNEDALRAAFSSLLHTSATDDDSRLASPGIVGQVCRGMFGLDFTPAGLRISPYVPGFMNGRKELRNLQYGKSRLFITLYGSGDSIISARLDGKPMKDNIIPRDLAGNHSVQVYLEKSHTTNMAAIRNASKSVMPPTPVVRWVSTRNAVIANNNSSLSYQLLVNGEFQTMLSGSNYNMFRPQQFTVINIIPTYESTWMGFSQPPYHYYPENTRFVITPDKMSRDGVIHPADSIPAGEYMVTFTYPLGKETATARLFSGSGSNEMDSEPVIFLPRTGNTPGSRKYGRSSSVTVSVGRNNTLHLRPVSGKLPEITKVVFVKTG